MIRVAPLAEPLLVALATGFGGKMQMSDTHNNLVETRSDEDTPIPMPPGEEPPPPIEEPPDKPVVGPDAPMREPGPQEPKRL